jgi:hypothetical protein
MVPVPCRPRESGAQGRRAQAALGARFRGHDEKRVGTKRQIRTTRYGAGFGQVNRQPDQVECRAKPL